MAFVGDVEFLSATFRDKDGALFDPTAVTFKVKKPDGTTETLSSLTNGSTGVYTKSYTPATVGKYEWFAIGTGANAKTESNKFEVLYEAP